jgi:hypothetical protein
MRYKKKKQGKCKLCQQVKELSFEHIPPSAANNKNTRYYEIPQNEYFSNAREYVFLNRKPKARLNQGGVGGYFLCRECNSFLGSKYVRDYVSFSAQCGEVLCNGSESVSKFIVPLQDINTLNVLKQMTAMFICCNEDFFVEEYQELREFVLNPNQVDLSSRYRFYIYLNNRGSLRSGKWCVESKYGILCEFTFPPLGIVLSIDSPRQIDILFEITAFKLLKRVESGKILNLYLNVLPTFYPFPLDFRDLDEIE